MTKMATRIQQYIDAGFPILYLNTYEEGKAIEAVKAASSHIENIAMLRWDGTDRTINVLTGEIVCQDCPLHAILDDRMSCKKKQILILQNIETFINDPSIIARLSKMAGLTHDSLDATIVIISPVLEIPKEIEKYVTVIEMGYPAMEEIGEIIDKFASEQEISVSTELKKKLSCDLKGLNELEIINILRLAYSEKGELTRDQTPLIFDQKQQMIQKAGILEMIQRKERLEDIGGLENLKNWLRRKQKVFSNIEQAQAFGVDMPKGVLIAGIPGCGKSLSAKATAALFDIPLLRLDMGRLLGKYVGESEANMRKAISLAEAISPCVLWVDELEKAFAGIGGDGAGAEVTTRLFGSFLTWLQEKESPVFVVATANDITKLPPELLRKGRFDEIFYVGLPNKIEREQIFEIHIKKRRPDDFTIIQKGMDRILSLTDGYSGADIEGVIRESVELAFDDGKGQLETTHIIQVINNTHSLSEIMREPIEKMEKEYQDRKFKNASK